MTVAEDDTSWMTRAACKGMDTAIFCVGDAFDEYEPPYPSREARRICERCPVRVECLAYAIAHDVAFTWGNTTEYQRRQLTRQQHRATCPSCGGKDVRSRGTLEVCVGCGVSWGA